MGWLSDSIFRHRWLYLFPQLLLFGLCIIYTYQHLKFDQSRDNLVGADKPYHRDYLNYKKEFPSQDDLVVVVESENMEKNRQFVERLGAKLEAETNYFTDVFFRGDPKMMGPKALLFFPKDDLKSLCSALGDYLPFIKQFTQATNLDSLFGLINSQFLHAKREANAENDSLIKAIPVLGRIVKQATASLQRPGTPPSPGVYALFDAGEEAEQQVYITFAKGRIYLVTAQARTEELNDAAVERLRDLVAQTEKEVPGLNIGVTGEPVLDHDEMRQSQRDSTKASIVSLLACALIFIYGYQETGRPLKATFCLLVGLAYTLAFATLTVGHLNILTITFVPILIGLAIDFGVHLITRYEEELRLGRSEAEAMHKAMVFTGQGIFTGALTTAAAFLAMWLTNFKGIQEMGIICGGGMLVCLVPMMTLLPVLLFRGRQNAMDNTAPPKVELRSKIENIWLSRPVTTTVITAVLTLLALTQFHKVFFDYDLLHMQSRGLPAVIFEQKLLHSSKKSVLFGAVVADTPQQAVEIEKKLKQLPTVSEVISMATYLAENPAEKLELVRQIKQEITPIKFNPTDPEPVQVEELSQTLYFTYGYLGMAVDEVQKDEPALAAQLSALRESINDLRKQMLAGDPSTASRKLAAFQQALFNDIQETFRALREQDDTTGMRAQDLPAGLRNRFVGVTGKYLLQVYPKTDVWQRDNQEQFVKELRTVDPRVTGTPVQLYEYTTLLKDSYEQAAWYALIAIAFMTLFHFRTFSSVILALLPVGIGCIWMGGLMGLFHIPFNPANIMTLPLVIGIGVTNGIHILNRFAEEKHAGILSKSTGKAVFVSGLTALSGFGSLILAQHQGIRSLGEVMSMGVMMCMIAALTFLPAVLNLFMRRSNLANKQPSADNARSTLGREEPR